MNICLPFLLLYFQILWSIFFPEEICAFVRQPNSSLWDKRKLYLRQRNIPTGSLSLYSCPCSARAHRCWNVQAEESKILWTGKKENLISCPTHSLPEILNLIYQNKEESDTKRVWMMFSTKTHCFIFRQENLNSKL